VAFLDHSMLIMDADPVERMAATQAATSASKAAEAGVAARVLREVSQTLPGALLGLALTVISSLIIPITSRSSGAPSMSSSEPSLSGSSQSKQPPGPTPNRRLTESISRRQHEPRHAPRDGG
jgi:hypothetical protein